jgi:uncharacterized membrane protein (DUF106 family)
LYFYWYKTPFIMAKNILIGILLFSNLVFGVAAYIQKVVADGQRQLAEKFKTEAEEQRIIAGRNATEAIRQKQLAEEQMKLAELSKSK